MHNAIFINNAIKTIDNIISIQFIFYFDGWRSLLAAIGGVA
jgi:hypothetical protein